MEEIIAKLESKVKKELEKDELPNAETLEAIRVLISYDMNTQLSNAVKPKECNS